MRFVVSDTTCVIDLGKAQLLHALLELPYRFLMPDKLFQDELLCLSSTEKRHLIEGGLEVRSLPGPAVRRAAAYFNRYNRLSLNDCFALTLAEETEDCALLTGDGSLRRVAEGRDIEVRGVLWVTDQLQVHEIVPPADLHRTLQLFLDDELVFLPRNEIQRRLGRLPRLLRDYLGLPSLALGHWALLPVVRHRTPKLTDLLADGGEFLGGALGGLGEQADADRDGEAGREAR